MNGRDLELVCPAGTPGAFKAAVLAGADVVYAGFRDETNARNFPGLNFSRGELRDAIAFAHDRGRRVYVTVNTFPTAGDPAPWHRAIDDAAALGADALILADIGLLDYARRRHPGMRRHLSVQASAASADAIAFYHEAFDVRRVVLPRVLTLDEIAALIPRIPVETEVFAFGGLCVMAEGRCALSGYITGKSPNRDGVCSPASHVTYRVAGGRLVSRLAGLTIDTFEEGEPAGYPTLCKGRFVMGGEAAYVFDEPASLNAIDAIPELMAAGVAALKIEGRQRGRAYVARVVAAFRQAVDAAREGRRISTAELRAVTEGQRDTTGALDRAWR